MHHPGLDRSFTQVLDAGYDIARSHFRVLLTLALAGSAPTSLFVAASTRPEGVEPGVLEAGLLIVGLLLSIGFLFYFYAALTHAVWRVALGEGIDLSRSFEAARTALPRAAWSSLVATLVSILGLICLVVPGLYVLLISQVLILPICVIEGRSGLSAVRRAHHLARGSLLSALGVVLVVTIASGVLSAFAQLLEGQGPLFSLPAAIIAAALGTLLQVSCYSVQFLSARARREALDGPQAPAATMGPDPWDRAP